jgi:DNA-binding NtrC family response regulator
MTVVLMTAHGSIDSAVEAIKLGAYDYLQKPFEFSELHHFMEKVLSHHRLKLEVRELKQELSRREGVGSLVTRSDRMKNIMELAMKVAGSNLSVLVEGESGTGKELLAHLIHDHSPRRENPFVTVFALPETMLEQAQRTYQGRSGTVKDRKGGLKQRTAGRCSWTRSERFRRPHR